MSGPKKKKAALVITARCMEFGINAKGAGLSMLLLKR